MSEAVDSFLSKIQEISDKKTKIFVKSKDKNVDFEPLSFKQQKSIISTIADGALGGLKFQKALNDIVLENSKEKDIKLTDRLGIILSLRKNSLGDVAKIEDQEVSIAEAQEKFKISKFLLKDTISDIVIAEVEIPDIQLDNRVINTCIESIKNTKDSEMGKNIADIYTYEIVKYVKSVEIDGTKLDFESISIKDRFKIVENLPIDLNKKIIEFIQNNKKKETEILTYDIKGQDKVLEIDVSFFDS